MTTKKRWTRAMLAFALLSVAAARADVVTDWNLKASEITVAHLGGPWGQAPMALIQVSVFEAVNAVTKRYAQAGYLKLEASGWWSTAAASARSWSSIDEFTREVINARIYDGVHYRTSGEVGNALGTKVGELAAAKLLR